MTQTPSNSHIDIFLVEDNPGDILLMQEAFNSVSIPHTLHSVTDGEQALDFLHKRGGYSGAVTPHIIILDLNVPKHSGYQILELIKTDPSLKLIPTIVISSSKAPTDVQKCYALHANSYITKPQTLNELTQLAQAIADFWLQCSILPSQ